jgi:vacuolar protein sorting-associated protein 13A/C
MILINAQLRQGSLTLRYSPHSGDKDLVSMKFDTFSASFAKRPDNFTAAVALQDFQIVDNATPGTLYPLLAKVQDAAKTTAAITDGTLDDELDKAVDLGTSPFFRLEFEHKPLNGHVDNTISLSMRNVELIYNRAIFNTLSDFFRPPTTALESIHVLIEAAGDKFEEFKEQTLAGIEFVLEEHQTWDVHIDIDAPIFIFPEW